MDYLDLVSGHLVPGHSALRGMGSMGFSKAVAKVTEAGLTNEESTGGSLRGVNGCSRGVLPFTQRRGYAAMAPAHREAIQEFREEHGHGLVWGRRILDNSTPTAMVRCKRNVP